MIDLSYLKNWAWEREYLSEIFSCIPDVRGIAIHWKSERLVRRWFRFFRLKYIRDDLVIPSEVDEGTVLVILSDELYRVPPPIPALAVLKQYVAEKDSTSVAFPLGLRRGFPRVKPVAIRNRPIDVGFIGRSYPHRKKLLRDLKHHPKLKGYRLELTCDARLSVGEYSEFLNDTKVSLCLAGNSGPETFRYYESINVGCIVVTPRMPANALYQDHPGIQVDNIDDADEIAVVLHSVLENSETQDTLQQRSLSAWELQYSPQAVAARIATAVNHTK